MKIYSIGQLSKLVDCKVPTIRYYEQIEILPPATRSIGNQRRYNDDHLTRLRFVRHSRALGFNLEEVRQLIHLQTCAKHSKHEAHKIAATHLLDVQQKIKQLQALEQELTAIVNSCHAGDPYTCQVLDSLS
ncbi:MAG: helix-turn-helix domain-containing protein [Gammaproteobacteria bacterium]|nr:helix-turn-helix domain-containing protein [Gammaproteobacteria bacterium]